VLGLFDTFDDATRELMRSLDTAGVSCTPVFVHYDGELPDGAHCPFVFYTGLERAGDPLFFNEVPIPAWCEIRQGREAYGEILREGAPIGRINYEPNSFRQVESVDWLLAGAVPSHTDHYDRYGNRYATTYYDGGQPYQSVYRGPGEWQVELNHVSRVVTMRSASGLLTFDTLTDFVSFFLDDAGLADDHVLINSLSSPLFVMRKRSTTPRTTLFWQEPIAGDLPGNMVLELDEPRALRRIVFFDERLRHEVAERHPLTALGLVYLSHLGQFADKPDFDLRRTFTLTHTDELPALAELLEAFPQVTFSIGALTLMSDKLHDLARRHPNLTLVPTITHRGIREELDRASVYLDIDAGAQVLDVVRAAYHLDLMVLALAPHAKATDHSRVAATVDELKAQLSAVVRSPQDRAHALDALHRQRGPLSSPEDYRRVLEV
jgi:accessory Sec system glycosyltransferase GtfB